MEKIPVNQIVHVFDEFTNAHFLFHSRYKNRRMEILAERSRLIVEESDGATSEALEDLSKSKDSAKVTTDSS